MGSTSEPTPRDEFARYVPWAAAGFVLVVAVPLGLTRGAPAVVLWVAFALLSGAVLLFWEALRTVLDPDAPGDEPDTDDEGIPADLDARKRAALQALKDIEFERSIGRLADDDYKELEKKYRAEARAAMKAIDDDLRPWIAKAEALLAEAVAKTDAKTEDAKTEDTKTDDAKTDLKADDAKADAKADDAKADVKTATCVKCQTVNDDDAVFCKKCGARMKEEAADASA